MLLSSNRSDYILKNPVCKHSWISLGSVPKPLVLAVEAASMPETFPPDVGELGLVSLLISVRCRQQMSCSLLITCLLTSPLTSRWMGMQPGSLTWEMCPHTSVVSYPQYKTDPDPTLGKPWGVCFLLPDAVLHRLLHFGFWLLKVVPLGAEFQAALVCLAQLFTIPYQPTSSVTDFHLSALLGLCWILQCSGILLCSSCSR